MPEKKKKDKKDIKARKRDLKPQKDAKGGYASRIYKASPISSTKAQQ
jgi:hypothetical protein